MGDFGRDDVERCRMFLPHLQRSAKVTRHLTASTSLMQSVHNTLEVHPDGIILMNRSGQILFTNRTAVSMAAASDSFVLRRRRILALKSGDNNELQRLLATAIGINRGPTAARGDAIQLTRSNGARSYIAVVAPLPRSCDLHEATVPVAYIIVSDPTRIPSESSPLLKKLFGLTTAEDELPSAS
jgi:PAS domain-containing protein